MKKREIKFRGYCKQLGKWLYGGLMIFADGTITMAESETEDGKIITSPVDPDSVGEITGLTDRLNNGIFEGDIVRILYTDWPSNTNPNIDLEDYLISISHVGPVIYQAPQFGVELPDRYGDKCLGSFNIGPHGRIEVIGNIYQNPELL